jgi:hypothetical protein
MGMSVWARNLALVAQFGASKHASAMTTLYFALHKGDPSISVNEPTSAGAYARVAKTNDATLWGTIGATDVTIINNGTSGAIAWPTATGLWSITEQLDYWGIWDNTTGGNLRYWGPLSAKIAITGSGDQARLPAGTFTLTQAG